MCKFHECRKADPYFEHISDGFELIIIIVATFGQAVLSGSAPTINIVVMLAIWRTIVSDQLITLWMISHCS